MGLLNLSLRNGKSTFEKDKTHEGSRLTRTWQSREAHKTSKWSRKRWWYADWKDEYGEIVSKPVGQEGLKILLERRVHSMLYAADSLPCSPGCTHISDHLACSHPGYYGKRGIRHFNKHKNRFFN